MVLYVSHHLAAAFGCRTLSNCCWTEADLPCRSLFIPQVRTETALSGASKVLFDWTGHHQSAAGLRKPQLQERLKILIQHSQVRSYLSAESLEKYREAERRHRLDPANNKESAPMAHVYEADLDCILRLLRCPGCSCLAAACAWLCLGCVLRLWAASSACSSLRMRGTVLGSCCVCCPCGRCLGAFVSEFSLLQPTVAEVPRTILPDGSMSVPLLCSPDCQAPALLAAADLICCPRCIHVCWALQKACL